MTEENSNIPTAEASLDAYLRSKIKKHKNLSMSRRLIALGLLLCATLLGALVVTNIGTKWFDADELSALTGVGAVLIALLRIGKFQDQAKWNKLKQRRLEGLHRRLLYEGASVPLVSAEVTKANDELERVRIWLETPEESSSLIPDRFISKTDK